MASEIRATDNALPPVYPDDIELGTTPEAVSSTTTQKSMDSTKQRIPILLYICMLVASMLFVFLSGYDFAASAAVMPTIGVKFSTLSTVNWVVVAYLLPMGALLPSVEKLANVCGYRPTLLIFSLLHIAGSVMSGAANGMALLLAGRAIAGVGAAGTSIIPVIAISQTGSKHQQQLGLCMLLFIWIIGSLIGLAGGGHLSTLKHWRWVFYFDVPFVVVALVLSAFAIRIPKYQGSRMHMLKRIDILGTLFIAGSVLTLVLALNYGGNVLKWSSGVVITLFVLAVFLFIVFIFIEAKMASEPILPRALFKTRTGGALIIMQPFIGIATFAPVVYLILWYDVVKFKSAADASLYVLAAALAALVASAASEVVVSLLGRCRPLVRLSMPLMALGCGLLIILDEDTRNGIPIIFMALLGVGIGMTFQPHFLMLRAAAGASPMAGVVASVLFLRLLGAAVGIALFNAVLQNNLSTKLAEVVLRNPLYVQYILRSMNNQDIVHLDSVPQSVRDEIIHANAQGFRAIFIACLVFAAVSMPLLAFVKRRPPVP
ncbi:MFS general substrate transporter [Coemansia reversa NRRL 1564]|uniref:MFS general substrate transporter n=1 Tax=Coemansia reversa (strain ATCC 12441 / NRRL 1564) TaxID=763665 RepID=A0A2G5BJ84_COERN|nr:MFS general substrate transporter [Coemansia reversa NRRL 1564]|eukprot:PIA19094.1 MFS general substrate transporter [Coemansia reversa NRRL 1564]